MTPSFRVNWFACVRATIVILAFSAFTVTSLPAEEDAEDVSVRIGSSVGSLSFTDIHYLPRTLSEFGDRKAYVVVFTTLDCPIVKRSLPTLKKLEEEYRDKGVQFVAINTSPADEMVDVADQAVRADLPFPVGKDYAGNASRTVGAQRTPECVVIDSNLILRYRGRIDATFRLSGVQQGNVRHDLREAIEDVLAGRDVAIPETPVDGCLITIPKQSQSENLTYHEHVAPLMKKHCWSCHQPDNAAPFSLTTFEDVNTHAAMIAEVVNQRRMPPWHGAGEHGHFENDPRIPAADIRTIVAWANGDRIEGDSSLALPKPRPRETDWLIGEPDLIIRMPGTIEVPADGLVPYHYAVLPYVFLKDTWIQKIEINPGNDAVVHHCNMGYAKITDLKGKEFHPEKNFITGYVPGGDPMVLDSGVGFCIPAGSIVGLQLHYVTTGKTESDQTAVGFVFAKETIQKQLQHFQCHTTRFTIPPHDSHHKIAATKTFPFDATGIGMYSHMHVRGKDMTFDATFPDGRQDILLTVANYNFEWQSSYRWKANTMQFPAETRIDCTAHFDNSTFNPFNPDPTASVRHGLQTADEMMFGFLFFTRDDEQLNLTIDPKTGHVMEKRIRE